MRSRARPRGPRRRPLRGAAGGALPRPNTRASGDAGPRTVWNSVAPRNTRLPPGVRQGRSDILSTVAASCPDFPELGSTHRSTTPGSEADARPSPTAPPALLPAACAVLGRAGTVPPRARSPREQRGRTRSRMSTGLLSPVTPTPSSLSFLIFKVDSRAPRGPSGLLWACLAARRLVRHDPVTSMEWCQAFSLP